MKRNVALLLLAVLASNLNLFAQTGAIPGVSNNLPLVSIRMVDGIASETGDNPGVFSIVRSSVFTNSAVPPTTIFDTPLTIRYSVGGGASNGVDYAWLPGEVVIPAGASNAIITIQPIDDTIPEPNEMVCLLIQSSRDYMFSLSTNAYLKSDSIKIIDDDNLAPSVQLVQPTDQAVFQSPTNILLHAAASDSDGSIRRVDFYRGTTLIGGVTNQNTSAPFYSLVWSNLPTGDFKLTARAMDNFELRATSAPVCIFIKAATNPPPVLPVVNVVATDPEASEPGMITVINDGVFSFTRSATSAGVSAPLTVNFEIGGTAMNQIDYTGLLSTVTIPAGATNAQVVVSAWGDKLVEGPETVIVTLRTNSAYAIGQSRTATVTILDVNIPPPTNTPPTVRLVSPTNNTVFIAPANIQIGVDANDSNSNGFIRSVEFFAGTNSLGVCTNYGYRPPGGPPFSMIWTNVPAGEYTLTARATDNEGASSVSAPVVINVQLQPPNPQPQPIVTITATDPEATEGANSAGTVPNTATFSIRRTENTNIALAVYYDISGTASNGIDYRAIPAFVTIPAGQAATNILICPLDDQLVEGTETVVLRLRTMICIAIYPPPPECYLIGTAREAQAVILDNDIAPTNQPPTVRLVSPTNNAVFLAPANIPLVAEAADSDGQVTRVDFFTGDRLLGSVTTAPYSLVWSNVSCGGYSVFAKAVDDDGAARISSPVSFSVRYPENTFARRVLPAWYVPGVKLLVQLRAEPRTNTTSYAVEDLPPAGWSVGVVSTNGVYDPADGKVKFGPFNNRLARWFSYEVTPPPDEKGEKRFAGIATADGVVTPILGAGVLGSAKPHPADRLSAPDFVISLEELNAYANAWKQCGRWSISPNPIPVNYLTRAGFLYGCGGAYTFSANYPTPFPPLLWVPLPTVVPPALTETAPANNIEPWFNSSGSAISNRFGTAISAMPTNYNIGVPFTVTITITPMAGVKAWAVEDRPPVGWMVTQAGEGGVFCPMTGKVSWGLFQTDTARTLTYTVTPTSTNAPAVAYFAGVASFDGVNVPVTGQRTVRRAASTMPPAKLQSVQTLPDGNRLLTFAGNPGACYILEATTNWMDWEPLEGLLNNDGALQYIDLGTNNACRFYRAVLKP